MKYRLKPYDVEALQWTGENKEEMQKFCSTVIGFGPEDQMILRTVNGTNTIHKGVYVFKEDDEDGYSVALAKNFEDIFEEAK